MSHTTQALVAFALALGFVSLPRGLSSDARSAPAAGPLTGRARVIDGDTIAIGETHIRLEGIDAPEAGQRCGQRWFGTWACGAVTTAALANRLAGKPVTCMPRGHDKYARTLAVCFVDGRDVNAWMVRQGYAWAFVRYSARYVRCGRWQRVEGPWRAPVQLAGVEGHPCRSRLAGMRIVARPKWGKSSKLRSRASLPSARHQPDRGGRRLAWPLPQRWRR